MEAMARNNPGYCNVKISIQIAPAYIDQEWNRHFLMSSSKLFPKRPAKKIPPNWPMPSLMTQVKAAEASIGIEEPRATKRA